MTNMKIHMPRWFMVSLLFLTGANVGLIVGLNQPMPTYDPIIIREHVNIPQYLIECPEPVTVRPPIYSPHTSVETIISLEAKRHNYSPEKWLAVARCESTLRAGATNGQYKGLFQIGSHWDCGGDKYNPVVNTRCAMAMVYPAQGWAAWSCA